MNKSKFELNENKYEAFYDGEICEVFKNGRLKFSGWLSDVIDDLIEDGLPKSILDKAYRELKSY